MISNQAIARILRETADNIENGNAGAPTVDKLRMLASRFDVCGCGHRRSEHEDLDGGCYASYCKCMAFNIMEEPDDSV